MPVADRPSLVVRDDVVRDGRAARVLEDTATLVVVNQIPLNGPIPAAVVDAPRTVVVDRVAEDRAERRKTTAAAVAG